MNTAVRILCILPKFHHITDLLMNLQWLPVHQLQKRGLLFLTKRLPRKRNQNWRTFDNFQKVIVCESQ